jgi:hypothetical protein
MGFLCCDRAMLDSLGYDEHLSRAKPDKPIAKLNFDSTRQYQKKVVRVLVLVPDELPLHLDHHQVVPVELTDHARLPVLRKCR